MEQQNDQPMRPVFSRRMVLAMGGGAAVAAFVASCSSDDSADTATTEGAAETTATSEGTETTMAGGETTVPATGNGNAAVWGGGGGDGTIKIGFTAPVTGALAGFGEANEYILGQIRRGLEAARAAGLMGPDVFK